MPSEKRMEELKPCPFCMGNVNNRSPLIEAGDTEVYIDGNGDLTLQFENGATVDRKINYCPECGESLAEPKPLTIVRCSECKYFVDCEGGYCEHPVFRNSCCGCYTVSDRACSYGEKERNHNAI